MPLDGHAYLVSYGWSGKGTGLREGSLSRPLAVAQKKTLSGLGKDRDEAFPFWDHVFSAASNSIQIKITASDDESSDGETITPSNDPTNLKRTKMGILCNRRPVNGTPASSSTSSGTSTPSFPAASSSTTTLSLLASAKREAAKRNLYSRFFKGPILGPDEDLVLPTEHQSSNPPSDPDPSLRKRKKDKKSSRSKKRRKRDEA
ncbi:hypothetical protein ONZ45_g17692 [Pleurotus djamor]|nr:hypothetical protein ONZ45_g17692 [Pleurotus djamor]